MLKNLINKEKEEEYFKFLMEFLKDEYETKTIYPPYSEIFASFEYIEQCKVVIIGQDPYHGPNQAHGFSFSVKPNVKLPKSLINIFKELESDLGIKRDNGNLLDWAKQQVLLLNLILTVEKGKPLSHINKGWEVFTKKIITFLNEDESPKVFILWGNVAQSITCLITNPKHMIIKSSHPSPLSSYAGFFGSKPFSKTNEFLRANNIKPIKWG